MARKITIIAGIIVVTFISYAFYLRSNNFVGDQTTITFFDIGQGDAIHIRTDNNIDILIDGGPDDQVIRRLGETMPFWDRKIELMVLSHPDADHISGLVPVFDYYTVDKIIIADVPVDSAVQHALQTELLDHNIEIIYAWSGDMIQLNDHESLNILHPFTDSPLSEMDRNDTSVVLEYVYSGNVETSVLLTGDIGKDIEHDLLEAGLIHDIDILKVGHHGSKYSSTAEFIEAAHPEYAVIQVGAENKFGHPTAEALDRLAPYAHILRNDEIGNIGININNDGYKIAP